MTMQHFLAGLASDLDRNLIRTRARGKKWEDIITEEDTRALMEVHTHMSKAKAKLMDLIAEWEGRES